MKDKARVWKSGFGFANGWAGAPWRYRVPSPDGYVISGQAATHGQALRQVEHHLRNAARSAGR